MQNEDIERAYRDHGWHVFRRSLRLLGDAEEARDVCQEVFVRLVRAGDGLVTGGFVRAWVFRTTTNLCIDRLRVRKAFDAAAVERLPSGDDVESEAGRRLLVHRLLARLPARDRALAVLRYVDGCTLEELEVICGTTRKTVSKRLARLRRTALAILGRDADPGGTP